MKREEYVIKYAHPCAYCDAVKIRHWRGYEVIDEWIENDEEECEHEWEDGERI